MIRRLYVHNFRCLRNFELKLEGLSSVLLVGKNGTGKTTVAAALRILQQIARGIPSVHDLIALDDVTSGHLAEPVQFDVEAELDGRVYAYKISLQQRDSSSGLVVRTESLSADGVPVLSREGAVVRVGSDAAFSLDQHIVALGSLQPTEDEPQAVFRRWLEHWLILRPVPSLIHGESSGETLHPEPDLSNFGDWWNGVLRHSPEAYSQIDHYLKQAIPDLREVRNQTTGKRSRNLELAFRRNGTAVMVDFRSLSDGEKCTMICALVLAANQGYGPLVCFWDEPDNYLALSEVGHFAIALRRAFLNSGQLICTSHNPEVLRAFSAENTFVLYRQSHSDPVLLRPLNQINVPGDRGDAMARGDLEPWD